MGSNSGLIHDPKTGHWVKGHAPMYRGLPAEVKDLRRHWASLWNSNDIEKLHARLLELVNDKDSRVALEALRMAFDRSLGKVLQEFQVETTTKQFHVNATMTPDKVEALRALLAPEAPTHALPPADDKSAT